MIRCKYIQAKHQDICIHSSAPRNSSRAQRCVHSFLIAAVAKNVCFYFHHLFQLPEVLHLPSKSDLHALFSITTIPPRTYSRAEDLQLIISNLYTLYQTRPRYLKEFSLNILQDRCAYKSKRYFCVDSYGFPQYVALL